MTAVASPPSFPQISRPAWGTLNGNGSMNSDEAGGIFVPRKNLPRSNSSSSISSDASSASNTTVASNGSQSNGTSMSTASDLSQWSGSAVNRNRQQPKGQSQGPWPTNKMEGQQEFSRMNVGRPNGLVPTPNLPQTGLSQPQMAPQGMMRPTGGEPVNGAQPALYLLSLNGTFERKTISVPFAPESLRIGRQTNQKTVPTPANGFFDSKVLSRQHAEIFAERNGKVYIRDVKSSNGTFVNGSRLSQENRESEPHELQTGDHLELGIDIVSEDQKTVVHHKVAAKVELSGFLNTSNNVMDMNFGDLDPANGSMMMPAGAVQMRGRQGSNATMANNRMAPNGAVNPNHMLQQQRPFFLTPIATDTILKRLTNEMRNAKLQTQDLTRTNQFINTLLSKDDIKDIDRPDGLDLPKPPPMMNGNGMPFRADAKTRFSEPPAPPPQQPLPEKPDVPSLKRGPTERPKINMGHGSPIRPDNTSQIVQLTEALTSAKRDFETQAVRVRELEDMLRQEREARELAEDLAKRLEESAAERDSRTALSSDEDMDETIHQIGNTDTEGRDSSATEQLMEDPPEVDIDTAAETASLLQARIDSMEVQMQEMRNSMEEWKQRCEIAEAERDDDRKTLAEMVTQLRAEEALRTASKDKSRSASRRGRSGKLTENGVHDVTSPKDLLSDTTMSRQSDGAVSEDDVDVQLPQSKTDTLTVTNSKQDPSIAEQRLHAALPYTTMVGVVLVGMGLMAYINGWQTQPSRLDQ